LKNALSPLGGKERGHRQTIISLSLFLLGEQKKRQQKDRAALIY